MSSKQSEEDLKAGGEGEELAEKGSEKGLATKPESASDVKSGAVSANASASRIKNGSVTAVKSVSVGAVKSGSATVSRHGSAQQGKSISRKASEKIAEVSKTSLGEDTTKPKKAGSSEVSVTSESLTRKTGSSGSSEEKLVTFSGQNMVPDIVVEETEEELEEEAGVSGDQVGSAELTAIREGTSKERLLDSSDESYTSERAVQRNLPASSFGEMALKKSSQLAPSAIWPMGAHTTQVNRMMSMIIESVAHSHATVFTNSAKSQDFSVGTRGSTAVVEAVSEMERQGGRILRSVWQDPEILEVLGPIRLDAFGENVISSREGSEEFPEGLTTQFDIDEVEEKHEKHIDQLLESKEEIRSIIVEVSPSGSVITGFWPADAPAKHKRDDLEVQISWVEGQELPGKVELARSMESSEMIAVQPEPTPTQPPDACDILKLTCFTLKQEISSEELSVCSSWMRPDKRVPIEVVHVKFRLVTGQVLKRIYRPNVIFGQTLCDLSQILCVPPESIQLFFKGEYLDLNATVWDVCGTPGSEVLIDADFCPEQIYCLVEKGIISFDDDEALKYFLLRRLPCVPEKKSRYVRPVSAAKAVPQPTSFIPGLVNDRKRDGVVSSALKRQLELARCVKYIQSSFRCYLSKRTFGRKERSAPEPIKVSPTDEAGCKRNALMKDVNLLTKEDFTVLYNLLGEWWQSEADAIKRNNSAAAKISQLFNLLLTEIDYVRHIEMHRCELKQRRRAARISRLVENVKEWKSLTMWERVELLSLLKGVASKLCLNSKTRVDDKNAIQATISSDMNTIIEGKYARNGDSACLCYCYTCHRTLPMGRFKPFTGTSRLYSCEKCQGVANLGRERRDAQAVRLLMEGVRREEARRGGCSWLPYIMQELDFVTLGNLWHNVSAVSGADASCGLRFVRWEPSEEWSPWNTVLLTREEAAAHRIDAYGQDFVNTVRKRHLTAKWTFTNLIELEKETRRKFGARDPKDNEGLKRDDADESNRRHSRPSETVQFRS